MSSHLLAVAVAAAVPIVYLTCKHPPLLLVNVYNAIHGIFCGIGTESLTWGDRVRVLCHLIGFRLRMFRTNLDTLPPPTISNPKFMSARNVAAQIEDDSVVLSCGFGGLACTTVFYFALADRFRRTSSPRNLSWIGVSAMGARGKAPGSVEELKFPGCLARFFSGHLETCKALLRLADRGHLELYNLPQGEMNFLLKGQASGKLTFESTTGVGTFLDPRVGDGRSCAVSPQSTNTFVSVAEGGNALNYTMPKVSVVLFNAPYADEEGNIYFHDAVAITEAIDGTSAAKANGGKVFVCVGRIIPKSPEQIRITADKIDGIVLNPDNEQARSIRTTSHWDMFLPGAADRGLDVRKAVHTIKFCNQIARVTPDRDPGALALARLGAATFVQTIKQGSVLNVGVGYGEEVCRLLFEADLIKDLTFTTEAGSWGGVPVPGFFFGAAISPARIETPLWMFERYDVGVLDACVLGFLQVDSDGNVNVSRRGPKCINYVGCGGFPNIVAHSKIIIFIGAWMAHARVVVDAHRTRYARTGPVKFVEAVDHITFSGRVAMQKGQRVIYVTDVGVFELTTDGLMLQQIMPGFDADTDIINASRAKIKKADNLKVVDRSVATGIGFALKWPQK